MRFIIRAMAIAIAGLVLIAGAAQAKPKAHTAPYVNVKVTHKGDATITKTTHRWYNGRLVVKRAVQTPEQTCTTIRKRDMNRHGHRSKMRVSKQCIKAASTDAQTVSGADGANGTNGANGATGLAGSQGPAGPAGQNGMPGMPGPAGPAASVGISHWSVGGVVPAATTVPGFIEVVATCQAPDQLAISGGYTSGPYDGGVTTYLNKNTADPLGTPGYGKGWIVGFTNTLKTPQVVRTWVVCAEVHGAEPTS